MPVTNWFQGSADVMDFSKFVESYDERETNRRRHFNVQKKTKVKNSTVTYDAKSLVNVCIYIYRSSLMPRIAYDNN